MGLFLGFMGLIYRGFNVECIRIFCVKIDYECWLVGFVLIGEEHEVHVLKKKKNMKIINSHVLPKN